MQNLVHRDEGFVVVVVIIIIIIIIIVVVCKMCYESIQKSLNYALC